LSATFRLLLALLVATPVALVLLNGHGTGGRETATADRCSPKSKCSSAKAKRGSTGDRLFAPDSVWNKPVEQRAGLDSRSAPLTEALANLVDKQIRTPLALNGGYPNIGADTYSTPIYRVSRHTRRVRVALEGDSSPRLRRILHDGVPIPPGAQPAAGSDGQMTIHQPSTDMLWEFWRARHTGAGWTAAWAGAMRDVSSNPGYYDSGAWGRKRLRFPDGWHWGSTATSLPVAGGTVTLAELRAGRINHALAMALPNVCRRVFSWPAQRSDGNYDAADCIPEGAHLRIDPGLKIDDLPLHPVAKLLAEAAQRYGMIVRDRTRVSAQFFLESPAPGRPSPYTGPGGLYRGSDPWEILKGFPWRSLQLLPMRLCTTAPCHPG
jgi:hypothetical protein